MRQSERILAVAMAVRELEDLFANDPGTSKDLVGLIGRRVAESAEQRYSSMVTTMGEMNRAITAAASTITTSGVDV